MENNISKQIDLQRSETMCRVLQTIKKLFWTIRGSSTRKKPLNPRGYRNVGPGETLYDQSNRQTGQRENYLGANGEEVFKII